MTISSRFRTSDRRSLSRNNPGSLLTALGLRFPTQSVEPADRESIFWIPSLQPEAVLLSTTSPARGSAAMLVDLTHLPLSPPCRSTGCSSCARMRRGDCGALLTAGLRAALSGDASSTQGIAYSDIARPRRAPVRRELSDHRRSSPWLRGTKTDWKAIRAKQSAPSRASGQHMMRGGYRTLLHYRSSCPAVSTLANPLEPGWQSSTLRFRHLGSGVRQHMYSNTARSKPPFLRHG